MAHDDHDHYNPNFDEKAATWDDPAKIERSRVVADAIVAAVAPDRSTRLLEYGAGTGLVTEALGDRVGPALLADSSAGMRDVMASKVADGRLRDARITDLDLASDGFKLPGERFDLIVTVMVMHHVTELDRVLGRFGPCSQRRSPLHRGPRRRGRQLPRRGFAGHHGFDRGELAAGSGWPGSTWWRYPTAAAWSATTAAGRCSSPSPAEDTLHAAPGDRGRGAGSGGHREALVASTAAWT